MKEHTTITNTLLPIEKATLDRANLTISKKLSNRELEVFQRIGQGRGTRQIAEELSLSIKTIEAHRAHLKMKLQVKTAPELVCAAVRWLHALS